MAHVVVTAAECDEFTGGLREFELEAVDIRSLLEALDARFPGLGAYMEQRVALAVVGEIIPAWTGPLQPHSEVCLIPRFGGG